MYTFPTLSSGSMKVYGELANGALAMYPATLSHNYTTRVMKFLGDQEQRFVVKGELFGAILQFHNVNGYDASILRDFFYLMCGAAASPNLTHTFDITIDGQNYAYCVFDQDEVEFSVDRGESYTFELRIRQLRPN